MANKIVIKKHRNRNHYCLVENGLWVRDFTKRVHPVDINNLINRSDYGSLISNQIANLSMNLARIDAESIFAPNILIVSDGYKFEEKTDLLAKLSAKKVVVIGTNRALAKWNTKAKMDYYVVNNPYNECMAYLPSHTHYYPRCVVSCRTNPEFVRRYASRRGVIYQYIPTQDTRFSGYIESPHWHIDDYRNPICAAIGLAYHWEVHKLALLCCDSVFADERPAAEQLPNGLWMYPQHRISHSLIDGNLYWLLNANKNLKVANCSSGLDYEHAPYIKDDELLQFF